MFLITLALQAATLGATNYAADAPMKAPAATPSFADEFAGNLSDPAALSAAANSLTADHDDKLLTLAPIIDKLEEEASECDAERALALRTLAAAMRAS